jgi:hypothetical protein
LAIRSHKNGEPFRSHCMPVLRRLGELKRPVIRAELAVAHLKIAEDDIVSIGTAVFTWSWEPGVDLTSSATPSVII